MDWGTVWTTLLTAVVAAVVAWIVSLLQRGREDRSAWRETRHIAYTAVNEHVLTVVELIGEVSRQRAIAVSPMETGVPAAVKRTAAALDVLEADVPKVMLMGHGAVHTCLTDLVSAIRHHRPPSWLTAASRLQPLSR